MPMTETFASLDQENPDRPAQVRRAVHDLNNIFMALRCVSELLSSSTGCDREATAQFEKVNKLIGEGLERVKWLAGRG